MRGPRVRRAVAALAVALGVPLLTGCDVAGRIDVSADRTVAVDLTVYQDADTSSDQACLLPRSQFKSVTATVVTDPADRARAGCRLTGTLAPSEQDSWSVPSVFTWSGDRVIVLLPAGLLSTVIDYGPGRSGTITGKPPTIDLTAASPASGEAPAGAAADSGEPATEASGPEGGGAVASEPDQPDDPSVWAPPVEVRRDATG